MPNKANKAVGPLRDYVMSQQRFHLSIGFLICILIRRDICKFLNFCSPAKLACHCYPALAVRCMFARLLCKWQSLRRQCLEVFDLSRSHQKAPDYIFGDLPAIHDYLKAFHF
jgi:hypothetical protein